MLLADETLSPINPPNLPTGETGLENIISTVIGFLTVVGGILFLVWFMIGAFSWITAEGKPEKLEKARSHITQALTGFIILVAAYAITALIGTILGLDFFNLGIALGKLQL